MYSKKLRFLDGSCSIVQAINVSYSETSYPPRELRREISLKSLVRLSKIQ